MSIQLQIEESAGYLLARFTGFGEAEEICRQFEIIAEHCERAKRKNLLSDFTGFYGTITFVDRYFLGETAQLFVRYGIKIVALARDDQVDPQKFGELVARNRGVNVHVLTQYQAAEKWFRE
jgi:hypothetical protein